MPAMMSQFFLIFGVGLILASLAFQVSPDSSMRLYLEHSHQIAGTCTSSAEWIWILVTSSLLLLPTILLRFCNFSSTNTETGNQWSTTCGSSELIYFVMLNLLWFLASLYQPFLKIGQSTRNPTFLDIVELLEGKAAWPALWNLAVVVFPVQRISPLRTFLEHQVSFCLKKTTVVHIWAGYAILFWLVLHTVLITFVYAATLSWNEWLESMLPYRNYYNEGVVNGVGWIALFMLIALVLTAQPCVRERWYEVFVGFHLLCSALFILFSNLHDYNTLYFVQPALVAWITERMLRRFSLVTVENATDVDSTTSTSQEGDLTISSNYHCNSTNDAAAAECSLISLTMSIPRSWTSTPRPGMFVHLKVPSISSRESHPISISKIDTENQTISMHIKGLGGWTSTVIDKVDQLSFPSNPMSLAGQLNPEQSTRDNALCILDERIPQSIPFIFEIEGPYGLDLHASLDRYASCLFIAGGVGLTGISEAVRRRSMEACRRKTQLIWLVHSTSEMEFLSGDLIKEMPRRTATHVKVFVTAGLLDQSQAIEETAFVKHYKVTLSSKLKTYYEPIYATIASIVGVALCFAIGRLVCCNHKVVTEDGTVYNQCSFLGRPTRCVYCDVETIKTGSTESPTCCTVEVCMFCFRGLPVVLSLVVAPIISLMLVNIFNRTTRFLNAGSGWFCYSGSRIASTEFLAQGEQYENVGESELPARSFERPVADPMEIDNHLTVEYKKPELAEIFLEYSTGLSDPETDPGIDPSTGEKAAIVVCGSRSLIQSVSHELKVLKNIRSGDPNNESPGVELELIILNPPV